MTALPVTAPGLFELRPVQIKALDMLRSSIRSGKRRPQLMLPTGAGKTVVAAHAVTSALAKGNRVAFTVPLLSLIDQTVERFIENGIAPDKLGVIQADHPLRRPDAPVQICSVQTLARREFPKVEFVLVDESHLQYDAVHEWMAEDEKRIFIGLSATPWAKGMAEHYDDLLVPATIRDLIASGDLCRFRAFAPTKPDLSGIKLVAGDYHEGQLSERMSQKSITADIVRTWLDRAEDRPTLVFAVDRAHAAKLHDEFASIGVRSAYVDAFTDRDEREAVKSLFHKGEIKVICSIGTMTHGVDMDVRCISFCRPTKSPILFVQALGRGLRNAPGKDCLLILDHSNSTLELGLPTDIGFTALRTGKRAKGGGEAKKKPLPSPRECPKCAEIVAATERHCPCGHTFQYVSKVQTLEGELTEVGATMQQKLNRTWTSAQKERFYGELLWHAAVRDFKPGWAAYAYKERFGVMPNAYRDAPLVEPCTETLSWIRSRKISWARSPNNNNKAGANRAGFRP